MSRVVATLTLSRSRVATSTTAGKALNCSACSMKSPIKKTPIDVAMLTARSVSMRMGGIGNTIIRTMPMIASGTTMSIVLLCGCLPVAEAVDAEAVATGDEGVRLACQRQHV